ncbi:MAG: ABC transporter permease, partial [Armatimonadetes bacterium]|nr:ABC transporter permease [Armatimonadota bacterium]
AAVSAAARANTALARVGGGALLLFRVAQAQVTSLIAYVGELVLLANRTVQHILRGEVTRREAFQQMAVIGVGSLGLVTITVGFSGMVFGVYGVQQFKAFGASNLLGAVTAMSMTREVGPVLTATVVAARSGSAIAAELATMKNTEQLDALRALATDPIEYLAVPRYIALVLMLPLLALVAMAAGTWGGGLVAYFNGITWREYFGQIPERVPLDFVVNGCIKAMIFGALIAVSSLRQGFRAGLGSESVGRATTEAVVLNIIWIHFANLLLAMVTE